MRKIIFQMMTSLDGYFEGPSGTLDWHVVDEEFNLYAIDLLNNVDALIFGRKTYELMASYWPTKGAIEDDPIVASKMTELTKIVYSKTLNKSDWQNVKFSRGENIGKELNELKSLPGKDMAVFGSSDLSLDLIREGLIDEYRIFVNPVVLGGGKTLFQGIKDRIKLKLTQTRTFQSGNVLLYYKNQ
ncbi:dihydrofolate reductase family protein [Leptospira barantonii]|uniref:Riboflavin biosynthesis protein RibD n=1 Tax=Leptospira barantonii TaxID=2023184 RepID=A0ABX4NGW4_9LEPT|nr:dihydrofolate reductase family protein [Leptospira barantonii]PJZ55559.1 riboflavin biosynthesis protein RibD [Leptospira barantonii]